MTDLTAEAQDLFNRLIAPMRAGRDDVALERIMLALKDVNRSTWREGAKKFLNWTEHDDTPGSCCAYKIGQFCQRKSEEP